MGEVFLAEDPRLRRRVAIKVLPSGHTLDPARKARFLAEARTASSLNHPNIVTIFDVGREGDTDYLVMEYVEGSSLREVLRKRSLPLREAADIAAQVARGLAAAHAKGIVHRDIKPENIMIGSDGTAKILDYGLAKLLDSSGGDAPTAERLSLTAPGAIVGTIAYMSPEQIQGHEVDHRTDMFSLGIVMWETICRRNPFAAPSLTATMQRIMTSPPQDTIPDHVPPRMHEIILRALALNPADRYQSARDFELDLRAASVNSPAEATLVAPPRRSSTARGAIIALVSVIAGALGMTVGSMLGPTMRDRPSSMNFAPLTTDPGYEGEPAYSSDGDTIAYVSDRGGNFDIFLKQISGGPDINLTNDPADDVQPSISPDGRQIAFVSTRSSETPLLYRNPSIDAMGGDIWVMSALGGLPKRIAQRGNFPAWSADSAFIIFVRGPWNDQRLYRIPAAGGEVETIPVTLATWPLFLTTPRVSPDGKWIAFTTHQPDAVCVVPWRGGKATVVAEGRHAAWQPDSKALVYSDLAPGRTATLSLAGVTGQGRAGGAILPITAGRGEDRSPAVSPDGRAVVYASQAVSFNIERVRFDGEAGKVIGNAEPVTRGDDFSPFFSVSPDGKAIVFQSQRGGRLTLWRQDIETGVLTQLAGDDKAAYAQPEWSPDGMQIAFVRTESGRPGEIWMMSSDGANPRMITPHSGFVTWQPGARAIAYYDSQRRDVRLLDLEKRSVRVLANEGTVRTLQKFSADGKWMLYQAIGDRGVTEVRVVAVGDPKSRVLVRSAHENGHPFFSPDLRWVYFQPDHKNIYRIPGPTQGWKQAPPQQVTFFPESNLYLEQPQLSADGGYLYYSRRSAASDLWIGKWTN